MLYLPHGEGRATGLQVHGRLSPAALREIGSAVRLLDEMVLVARHDRIQVKLPMSGDPAALEAAAHAFFDRLMPLTDISILLPSREERAKLLAMAIGGTVSSRGQQGSRMLGPIDGPISAIFLNVFSCPADLSPPSTWTPAVGVTQARFMLWGAGGGAGGANTANGGTGAGGGYAAGTLSVVPGALTISVGTGGKGGSALGGNGGAGGTTTVTSGGGTLTATGGTGGVAGGGADGTPGTGTATGAVVNPFTATGGVGNVSKSAIDENGNFAMVSGGSGLTIGSPGSAGCGGQTGNYDGSPRSSGPGSGGIAVIAATR